MSHNETDYLLIGGGAASVQAAKRIRKLDANASVTIVSREDRLPYDRPPLTKGVISGEKDFADILLADKQFYETKDIRLISGVSGERLDPAGHHAALSDGSTFTYGKALIATGGSPVKIDIPGMDTADVYYLRTFDDAMFLRARAKSAAAAVIIGAGFIGLETAASLTGLGITVTVIEKQDRIWSRFAGGEFAGFVQRYCERQGVRFLLGDSVERIERHGSRRIVVTSTGTEVPADFLCIGIGIRPETEPAAASGLDVDKGIVVDEHMRTSHPDIFAAGDVVSFPDRIFGRRRRVEHWSHARATGSIAGANMAGSAEIYEELTTVWSDIFGLHIDFAGDEFGYDTEMVRGEMGADKFIVLYLKENRLRAYCAVNTLFADVQPLQRMIREQADLTDRMDRLRDIDASLKE